ncbi:TPA: hypothetical protein G9E90_005112 [Salmonella enterica]|nr:hypothetical protein [Salmonella enterica]
MRGRIRSWKMHRWAQLTIKELTNSFNHVLQGWINYYGKLYKSKFTPIFDQLNYSLVRWVRRKYKQARACAITKVVLLLMPEWQDDSSRMNRESTP